MGTTKYTPTYLRAYLLTLYRQLLNHPKSGWMEMRPKQGTKAEARLDFAVVWYFTYLCCMCEMGLGVWF